MKSCRIIWSPVRLLNTPASWEIPRCTTEHAQQLARVSSRKETHMHDKYSVPGVINISLALTELNIDDVSTLFMVYTEVI